MKPFMDEEYGLPILERDLDGVDLKEGSFSGELQVYRSGEPNGRRVERGIQRR